jgi:hypothetical protein
VAEALVDDVGQQVGECAQRRDGDAVEVFHRSRPELETVFMRCPPRRAAPDPGARRAA